MKSFLEWFCKPRFRFCNKKLVGAFLMEIISDFFTKRKLFKYVFFNAKSLELFNEEPFRF